MLGSCPWGENDRDPFHQPARSAYVNIRAPSDRPDMMETAMKRLKDWTAGLSKGEFRGMIFGIAAALGLTVIGTGFSYSTVTDVRN